MAMRSRAELKAATKSQNEAATAGYALVEGVRKAVVRVGAKASEKKDFGVGLPIRRGSVPQIVAGLDAVLAGAAKNPELARRAGILPVDLDKASGRRTALAGADRDQATKKETAKSATASRTATQKSVEADVDAVCAGAELAFHDDTVTLQSFRDLTPSKGKRRANGGGNGTPAGRTGK